ncbi:MAG: sigma factor [Oscillospiraceae bacterium]
MCDELTYKKDKDVDTKSLLLEFYNTRDEEIRNKLVLHYSYIAKASAIQLRGVFQNYAQIEDIINQGIITLIDCIEKYEPEKSNNFESYAYLRVKGSIISLVRQQDWIPRRVRMAAKRIKEASENLCNELMREPTNAELAERLEVSEESI